MEPPSAAEHGQHEGEPEEDADGKPVKGERIGVGASAGAQRAGDRRRNSASNRDPASDKIWQCFKRITELKVGSSFGADNGVKCRADSQPGFSGTANLSAIPGRARPVPRGRPVSHP
jgi:hypothetical protein